MNARILRLNIAGQPVEWLHWQEATCLYARGSVVWTLGDTVRSVTGGISRITGKRSRIALHSIVACAGHIFNRPRVVPPMTNRALFRRDLHMCMYCGRTFKEKDLTRDHILPKSRGGRDIWPNVIAACRRCNQRKGNRTPEEAGMEILSVPYQPNVAEWLALINSDRIRGDQVTFLKSQFGPHARWAI